MTVRNPFLTTNSAALSLIHLSVHPHNSTFLAWGAMSLLQHSDTGS